MNTNHFGKNTQDSHRALGKNEMRQRYSRKRDDDPELAMQGNSVAIRRPSNDADLEPWSKRRRGCYYRPAYVKHHIQESTYDFTQQDLHHYAIISFLKDIANKDFHFGEFRVNRAILLATYRRL